MRARLAAAVSGLLLAGFFLAILAGYALDGAVSSRFWDLILVAAAVALFPLVIVFGQHDTARPGTPALAKNAIAILAGLATTGLIWLATDSQPAGPAVLIAGGVAAALIVALSSRDVA